MEKEQGVLYLCATPIGNLEDMTFRAVRMMKEVDLIAAEDTRHTRKLLSHYDIHTPLTSYHEHNKFEKGPQLIETILSGQQLLLVSDAGLPGIADPGSHLAELAIAAGIAIIPLPGANAALSGLICSGLDTTRFSFAGFLPKTTKKRKEVLASLKNERSTLIFYESPHRIKATLKELSDVFGENRKAALARELTKKFEEFIRGTLGEVRAHLEQNQPRGEFCIIIAGCDLPEEETVHAAAVNPVDLVAKLVAENMDKKAAIKQAAKVLGLGRREVYQMVADQQNTDES